MANRKNKSNLPTKLVNSNDFLSGGFSDAIEFTGGFSSDGLFARVRNNCDKSDRICVTTNQDCTNVKCSNTNCFSDF